MGTSKALLLFDDEPLIVHVVATLQRLFADVVVVAAPEQDLPSMPVRLVSDEVAYQGPVGGIYYGLMAAGSDAAFVTSCDSVFLNIDLIAHLLDQLPEHDVVVFMEGGEIVDARFGDIIGVEAVRRALRLREGEFHVDLNVTTEKRTVFEPCNKLLLEEMVSDDEAKNGEPNGALDGGPEEIMIPKSQPLPPRRGSPIPLVIIGSAAIAAAAVGGALWWRSQQEAAALAE